MGGGAGDGVGVQFEHLLKYANERTVLHVRVPEDLAFPRIHGEEQEALHNKHKERPMLP